jgi:hypothetical protein
MNDEYGGGPVLDSSLIIHHSSFPMKTIGIVTGGATRRG